MLVVKTLHLWMVISWFAGLFYLPRIFVNLAMVPADSVAERDRLLLMAGKLYRFMTPLGVLAVATGLWLWLGYGFAGGWLHAKTRAGRPAGPLSLALRPRAQAVQGRRQRQVACLVPFLQ